LHAAAANCSPVLNHARARPPSTGWSRGLSRSACSPLVSASQPRCSASPPSLGTPLAEVHTLRVRLCSRHRRAQSAALAFGPLASCTPAHPGPGLHSFSSHCSLRIGTPALGCLLVHLHSTLCIRALCPLPGHRTGCFHFCTLGSIPCKLVPTVHLGGSPYCPQHCALPWHLLFIFTG